MSLSTLISVSGINLAELFVELYNNAKVFNHAEVCVITRGDAERLLKLQQRFGKFCGKYIEVDFESTTINFYWYNRRNGINAGQAAVKRVMAKQQNRPPEHVLRQLEKRKNPTVQIRQNRTNDFIPNANSGLKNTSFMYGGNTTAMNVIHPPRRAKSVDTSTLHNPATLPANIPERKKPIQVINPRFNPELYVISNTELAQMLNDYVPPSNNDEEPSNTSSTSSTRNVIDAPDTGNTRNIVDTSSIPMTVNTRNIVDISNTPNTASIRDVESSFNSEPVPVRMPRPIVQKKHVESPVPIPEPMPAPLPIREEPMVIPKEGLVIDSVVDGEEKTNEPVSVNRFKRSNRKKLQGAGQPEE